MKTMITGATGFIGRNLVPALLQDQHTITVVGRNTQKINNMFGQRVHCAAWHQLNQLSRMNLTALLIWQEKT